jgi:hypothetical protein
MRREARDQEQGKKGKLLVRCLGVGVFLLVVGWPLAVAAHSVFTMTLQRIPRKASDSVGAIQGTVSDQVGRPLPGAKVSVTSSTNRQAQEVLANAEGVFRCLKLQPGEYDVRAEKSGHLPGSKSGIIVTAGELVTIELRLEFALGPPEPTARLPRRSEATRRVEDNVPEVDAGAVRSLPRRPGVELAETPAKETELGTPLPIPVESPIGAAGPSRVRKPEPTRPDAVPSPDRWRLGFPEWDRETGYEAPYHRGRWWDPYNQNVVKGDYPIFGQNTFFNITGTSETLAEPRRLYVPSNVSSADPLSEPFFGRGEQFFLNQNLTLSFNLFHGDTAFKPIDWQIKVTPVINVNYLNTRENGLVNIDVRRGTNRTDGHLAFQELFGEVKLADVSPNYDFISLRVGIQQFTSDFRGFIFVENQPGVRLFGNFKSNHYQWNLAAFSLLEKDTNSRLNTVFDWRHQNVFIANLYRQDFIKKGYTIQGSLHYSDDHAGRSDEGGLHFDTNGFLVRPSAVGIFKPHNIKVGYLGVTGDGHIGRLNLSHAFYQAFGRDDHNPIANRGTHVNAQMVAAELSLDRDWLRFKGSFFYSSGDDKPLDGRARGFDSIVDNPNFAGGGFSFFNRQSLRLTGTFVEVVGRESLLPNLRSSKDEGQANFVNPGLFLYHVGVDAELTPKLRGFANVSFLRFDRTESLELLLYQAPIRHGIGVDYGLGFLYRPPLTENIVVTAGAAALTPWSGFKDIFTSKTLYSTFTSVRFTF